MSHDELLSRRVVYVEDAKIFVVANGDDVVALRSQAPHVPEDHVLFCPSSGWFEGHHGERFDALGAFENAHIRIDADDFTIDGFDVAPGRKSKPLVMTFKKPDELVGNHIAKYQSIKLAKMLMAYDFDRQLNPFVEHQVGWVVSRTFRYIRIHWFGDDKPRVYPTSEFPGRWRGSKATARRP